MGHISRLIRKRKQQKTKASKKAQQLAAEHGVDLSRIKGTGKKGSITVRDVNKHLASIIDASEEE